MRLIDSHAHLQSDPFDTDRAAVVAATFESGVERLLVLGWDAGSSARALSMAQGDARIDAAAGVHPHDATRCSEADWAEVVRLAADPRVVAIGETGLDYDRMRSPREAQLANLRRHLRLALDTGKPAILHCRSAVGLRDAQDDLLVELWAIGFGEGPARATFGGRPPAVLHSFSGPVDYAAAALELGLAISFSGLVFRVGEEASAEVARLAPGERLLIETDSPYLAPPGVPRGSVPGFGGRRNSPPWVRVTGAWLAKQRGQSPDSIGAGLVAAYDATFRSHSAG
ncbi:MAG: TatD family hydrolase [Candidatus Limnocylindrales bacterium]|jgi:TatD DNase family protein